MMSSRWKWLLLLAVVAAPWLRGLSHPFLYDDIGMIAENTFLEDPANFSRVLTGRTLADPHVVNGRRPAVLATYFIDRALYGLQPAGWRITSLLLHLGCVALLAALLWRLTGRRFLAAAAGILFGLHPVLSEAVHAPGFRADVLCGFFVLLALHGQLARGARAAWARAAGTAAFGLALLSKETALAAPLLLAGIMMLFPAAFPDERRDHLRRVAWWGGLAAGFFLLWLWLPADLQAAGGAWNGESLRHPQTWLSVPALWLRTLRLLLVPWPLNVTPAFEPVDSAGSLRFLLGLAWLGACVWAAGRARRAAPPVSLGLLWLLVFFLPVSNLWPLLHPVADRYFYPLVPGFAILAAWLLANQSRTARGCGLAALAGVYALLLSLRLGQWQSAEQLWTAAYFQNSNSATAATWLGLLREAAGDPAGARQFYEAAVKVNPRADAAWVNWGILEGRAGAWAESERLLRRAIEVRPEGEKGWRNLAVCLERQGRTAEAQAAAERAAALAAD